MGGIPAVRWPHPPGNGRHPGGSLAASSWLARHEIGRIARGTYVGLQKRPRTTRYEHLQLDQARELINAVAFAEHIDYAPTVSLTILWRHQLGFNPDAWAAHQTHLFNLMNA